MTLDVDRVRLPDGGESVREVVRHAGAVVILPVLDDGRIAFVRQFRYPVEARLLRQAALESMRRREAEGRLVRLGPRAYELRTAAEASKRS